MLRAGWIGVLSLLLSSQEASAQEPQTPPPTSAPAPLPLVPAMPDGTTQAHASPAPPRVVVRQEERSGARKYIGMSFTGIGIAHTVIGAVTLAGFWAGGGEFGPLVGLVVGAPILFDGSVLLAVGIPLWTTGAEIIDVEVEVEPEPSLAPSVQLGPTGASLNWSF